MRGRVPRTLICPKHRTENLYIVELKPGGSHFADVECRVRKCMHRMAITAKQTEGLLKRHKGIRCADYDHARDELLNKLFEFRN